MIHAGLIISLADSCELWVDDLIARMLKELTQSCAPISEEFGHQVSHLLRDLVENGDHLANRRFFSTGLKHLGFLNASECVQKWKEIAVFWEGDIEVKASVIAGQGMFVELALLADELADEKKARLGLLAWNGTSLSIGHVTDASLVSVLEEADRNGKNPLEALLFLAVHGAINCNRGTDGWQNAIGGTYVDV